MWFTVYIVSASRLTNGPVVLTDSTFSRGYTHSDLAVSILISDSGEITWELCH
jgi:hypothetical protein